MEAYHGDDADKTTEPQQHQALYSQACRPPPVEGESAGRQSVEKWEARSWGREHFGSPVEAERPPLEAATKQRNEDRNWEH
jgi:hypothetical protein